MRLAGKRPGEPSKGTNKRSAVVCSAVCVALFCGAAAFAQQRAAGSGQITASDLANDNLDLVAASETQIATVLHNSPGLLVELKRWVAKDAADRGQVVEDTDLSDTAIYTRLGKDQKFRGVATRLLQRYGYLVAEVNPLSELGREQSALAQERIRQKVAAEQAAEQASLEQAKAWKRCDQDLSDANDRDSQSTQYNGIPYDQNSQNSNSRDEDSRSEECQQQRGLATSPVPGVGLGFGVGTSPGQNSPDRDFNDQLGVPALTAPTSTPPVLRTAANPPGRAKRGWDEFRFGRIAAGFGWASRVVRWAADRRWQLAIGFGWWIADRLGWIRTPGDSGNGGTADELRK